MAAVDDDKKQIHGLVRRINDAWLKGPADSVVAVLMDCFDDRMIIKGPGMVTIAEGKAACARSYSDFLGQAAIRECHLDEPEIHAVSGAAIAAYGWTMTYVLNGQEYQEAGYDVFAFTRIDGSWKAMWRLLLPGTQT
jgi:hypothetical protein